MTRAASRWHPAVVLASALLLAACGSPAPEAAPASEPAPAACSRTAAAPDGPGETVESGADYAVTFAWRPFRLQPVDAEESGEACAVQYPVDPGGDAAAAGALGVGETVALDDEGTRVTLLAVRAGAGAGGDASPPGAPTPLTAVYRVTYPDPPTTGCRTQEPAPTEVPGEVVTRVVEVAEGPGAPVLTSDGCGLLVVGAGREGGWLRVGSRTDVAASLPGSPVAQSGAEGATALPAGSWLLSVARVDDVAASAGARFEARIWVPAAP